MRTKRLLIDFDGVITSDPAKAREIITEWIKECQIIIYTSRCRRHQKEETENMLKMANIPYDELYLNKPEGDIYLDDRAVEFFNWNAAKQRLDKFIKEPHKWGTKNW